MHKEPSKNHNQLSLLEKKLSKALKRAELRRLYPILALSLFVITFFGVPLLCMQLWQKLEHLKQERSQLQAKLTQTTDKQDYIREKAVWIHDPAYLQIISRDSNDLQLPGETVFRLLPYTGSAR